MSDSNQKRDPILLEDYVELAATIEDRVAGIYDHFGEQFAEHAEFSYFWKLSAQAERYHAATIRLHAVTLDPGQPIDEDRLPVEVEEARSFVKELGEIHERIQASPLSPQEALEQAIQIESEGSEVHGRTQFGFLYPALSDLFERLEEEDRAHRRSFQAARKRFAHL